MKRSVASSLVVLILVMLTGPASAQCVMTEDHKFVASDPSGQARFAKSISMAGDWLAVGANGDDGAGVNAGACYLFEYDGDEWIEREKLVASDATAGAEFGIWVEMSGDVLVVGAWRDGELGTDVGAAYVYRRSGSTWTEELKLLPSDGQPGDHFGQQVSIDGDLIGIGAWRAEVDGIVDCGAAYLYRDLGGGVWNEEARLVASDRAPFANFGWSIAVDEETVVVGAWRANSNAGSAYVFRDEGSGWQEEVRLKPMDTTPEDFFGDALDVSGDLVLVGAKGKDSGDHTGAAYLFRRTGGVWGQEKKLTASDRDINDRFGASLELEGELAFVGAWRGDDGGNDAGSAYVYRFEGGDWREHLKLLASDPGNGAYHGWSLTLDGEKLVLGAYGAGGAGACYAYRYRELILSATPHDPSTGDVLLFDLAPGTTGTQGLLFATEIAGAPTFLRVGFGPFDASCHWSFGGPVPPGFSGISATFEAYGISNLGNVVVSNGVTIDFQ